MGTFTTVILLAFMEFMTPCRAMTMDEMISAAAQTSLAGPSGRPDSDTGVTSDTMRMELDIMMKRTEWEQMERENAEANSRDGRQKRKATNHETKRWTNKIIPYKLEHDFSPSEERNIKSAMFCWEHYTCLKFRPAGNADKNYLSFISDDGCWSYVGMQDGRQKLSLSEGCRGKPTIRHELGHALGFWHEQSRPDRDSYVRIIKDNIKKGEEHNFMKYTTDDINSMGVQYDYFSIMHYGKNYFAIDKSKPTIETVDKSKQDVIGNRKFLSFRDIKLANLMYQCNAHCSPMTCPGEGFVGKDCKCWCPCPFSTYRVCRGVKSRSRR